MRLYTGIFITVLFSFCCSCGKIPSEVKTAYDALPEKIGFNTHIRPILSDKCFPCHGPDEKVREAGLRLDIESGIYGALESGDGTAFTPGLVRKSVAVKRILADDNEVVMPPPESNLYLNTEEKAALIKWVEQGAEWQRHWSYITPEKIAIQADDVMPWGVNEVDRFVYPRMRDEGLSPGEEASSEVLIRRLYLDLTGLPPEISVVDSLLPIFSDEKYEQLVDHLLSSQHFGERWAWNWLDVARYADTNGFQGDPERKMWPWRDWVVKAFNDNMPFDQFSIEQLAGDLLPNATQEQILATAFNRNHMYNGEGGRIPEETRVENVFDRTETFGTVWLGMTFNCARCHDHKFDQLTQKEYYQIYDYFNQTSEEGIGYNGRIKPVLDLSNTEDQQEVAAIEDLILEKSDELAKFELQKFPRKEGETAAESEEASELNGDHIFALGFHPIKRNPYYLGLLSAHFEKEDKKYHKLLKEFRSLIRKKDELTGDNLQVMVMDHLERPRPTYILDRGIYDKRGERVYASVPSTLSTVEANAIDDRLELARWLFSPGHPLTSRVIVNRYWQALFGRGLVETPEDFGVQGSRPSHPDLLDWLAVDFRESGWDFKALIKKMVMSATYRQGSQISPLHLEKDPDNIFLSRSSRYRLPSWMLRDQALFLSGLINDSIGGVPIKPYQPPGIWEEATFGFKKYERDRGDALYRRSLYIFWRRIVGPTMLFDNAARQVCEVKPKRTNTPLHALVTLNDITYAEAARVMAARILRKEHSEKDRIDRAFRLATCRHPNPGERTLLLNRFEELYKHYSNHFEEAQKVTSVGDHDVDEHVDLIAHAAYTGICSIILNLDEVLTKQ